MTFVLPPNYIERSPRRAPWTPAALPPPSFAFTTQVLLQNGETTSARHPIRRMRPGKTLRLIVAADTTVLFAAQLGVGRFTKLGFPQPKLLGLDDFPRFVIGAGLHTVANQP